MDGGHFAAGLASFIAGSRLDLDLHRIADGNVAAAKAAARGVVELADQALDLFPVREEVRVVSPRAHDLIGQLGAQLVGDALGVGRRDDHRPGHLELGAEVLDLGGGVAGDQEGHGAGGRLQGHEAGVKRVDLGC
jgi:hypothetical protein